MKRRIVLSLALLAGLSLFASASSAQAFNLFGRGYGCAEPSCCAPEPSCCDPCAPRHRGLFAGLFNKHRNGGCCDTGCDVGCAEPACAAPVEVGCCAPEPTCCDPCGRKHRGLFRGLFSRHHHAGCCDSGCGMGCAEPACAAPVEVGCCAPEPTCCDPCGRKHRGLFRGLFHRHNAGCCDTGCNTGCDMGCAEPTCCGG